MPLFPYRIERIPAELTSFAEVKVPHGAFADYVVDAQGREWVRKKEINTGFQGLLAEAFGSLFAAELHVRVPQAAIQECGGEKALFRSAEERRHG